MNKPSSSTQLDLSVFSSIRDAPYGDALRNAFIENTPDVAPAIREAYTAIRAVSTNAPIELSLWDAEDPSYAGGYTLEMTVDLDGRSIDQTALDALNSIVTHQNDTLKASGLAKYLLVRMTPDTTSVGKPRVPNLIDVKQGTTLNLAVFVKTRDADYNDFERDEYVRDHIGLADAIGTIYNAIRAINALVPIDLSLFDSEGPHRFCSRDLEMMIDVPRQDNDREEIGWTPDTSKAIDALVEKTNLDLILLGLSHRLKVVVNY